MFCSHSTWLLQIKKQVMSAQAESESKLKKFPTEILSFALFFSRAFILYHFVFRRAIILLYLSQPSIYILSFYGSCWKKFEWINRTWYLQLYFLIQRVGLQGLILYFFVKYVWFGIICWDCRDIHICGLRAILDINCSIMFN